MLIKAKTHPFPVLFAVALAGVAGCASETKKPVSVGPAMALAGFQCLPLPTEFLAAGSIFSTDREGATLYLGAVPGLAPIESTVHVPSYTSSKTFKLGAMLKSLDATTARKWSGKLGGDAGNNVSVTTVYGGTTLWMVPGQPEPAALVYFKSKFKGESGMRYFLVREAIQASKVNYEVKRGDSLNVSGAANVHSLVDASLNVAELVKSDSYTLAADYTPPVNVCIKARELHLGSGGVGNKGYSFSDVTDSNPIVVTSFRQ